MAKNKKEEVKKPKKKKSLGVGTLSLIIAFGFVFKATSLLLVVGLLPSLVMYVVERKRTPYLTFCIASMNLMAVIPFLSKLWQEENNVAHVLEMFLSPQTWLVIYGGASIGLAIYSLMPSFVRYFRNIYLNKQLVFAEKEKQKIIKDWGDKLMKDMRKE